MLRSFLKSAGLFVALAVLSCLVVEAQITCSQLKAVKIWKGSYELHGVGSGSFQGESIKVNHTMKSIFTLTLSGPTGNCSHLVWKGADSSSSGSLNDIAILPPATQTLVGEGSNRAPPPQLTLTIDATHGTYTFSEGFGVLSTLLTCAGGCIPVTTDFAVEPLTPAAWPQPPHHLPSSELTLSGTATFSGQPVEWEISVPWTLTWDIRAGCEPPTGETTAFDGWVGSLGTWKQTLISTDGFDFSGSTVKEVEARAGEDACWFVGSAFAKAIHLDPPNSSWDVNAGNTWGDDAVGWKGVPPNPVFYYRAQHRAPCGFTLYQQMTITCSDGSTYNYGHVNTLRGVIGTTVVQSGRAGKVATRSY